MFFKKREKIRELEDLTKNLEERLGAKTDLIEALRKECGEKLKKIKSLREEIIFLENENSKGLEETKKIINKLEKTEQSRKKLASSKGGYILYIKRLDKQINDYEALLRKKELDYLFALKLIFRKSKLTGDTKAFLGHRLKELQQKYESNRGDDNVSNV
jgi:chromosome segregation ATPase